MKKRLSRKKTLPPRPKARIAPSAGKRRLSAERSSAAEISREAERIAADSRKLYSRAHEVQKKSDEVHHGIEDLHRAVSATHDGLDASEATEIVTHERSGGDGKPFTIVGVGASAGGYEAFDELLTKLPRGIGMAVVLVQHLDPKHKSKLTELLGHSTKLPVTEVHDDMPVEPDHIYVIPENATMTLSDGKLRLSRRKESESPPMPIDAFFRSLAQEQQNRAIGIVLSGTGTDGTLGLEAIKGEGGITFAQNEETAKYFGMPRSAFISGAVDFVMSPVEIAGELGRIARHPYVDPHAKLQKPMAEQEDLEKPLKESPNSLNTLFTLLRVRKAVDFALYKQSTLKRRIMRRMVLHKIDKLSAYIHLVQTNSGELDALFQDLLINVTSFFRDPATFNVLKKKIFPKLLKSHEGDSPLRMWVCGCSTGQEAYSLAMTLVEFFEQTHSHRPAQIFATDISDAGVERARAGIYPENILQDVSPERLRRFFTKVDGNYQVRKSIRDMCLFARQNVLVDPPFSNLDLITCRNVLIYFGPILQRKIIPLFHYALRREGFLVLGHSETIGASADQFSLVDKKQKIYLRKESFTRGGFDISRRMPQKQVRQTGLVLEEPAPTPRQAKTSELHDQVDQILLRDFSPGAVVVDEDFNVVQFRGRTGDFLEHAPGMATLSLLKMARESLVMHLRAALAKASKQDTPVRMSGIELKANRHDRQIALEIVPFRLSKNTERFFLVAFKDREAAPPPEELREQKGGSHLRKVRQGQEIARLRHELNTSKISLNSVIEEQEATNEELKSANEEIQSSNEELQSTNEELETAKEELQSTNEELTTLNEELNTRNAELSIVNNDLSNLIASVNVAILMLGHDLTLRRYTPMAERVFNLIPSDLGRSLSDISRGVLTPNIEALARDVIDNLTTVERETQDRDGNWFLLRIRPYRTREHKIDGAVILLVDISAQRRATDAILSMVNVPIVAMGIDCKIRNCNNAFKETFKLKDAKISGVPIFEIAGGMFQKPELHKLLEATLQTAAEIVNYDIEDNFGSLGPRKFRINARRFAEDPGGMEMILMAMEDLTGG